MFACIVIIIARTGWLRTCARAGAFSYTLYIVHYPILLALYFWFQPLAHPLLWWTGGVILATSLAMAIAPWAEDVNRWKRRVSIN